MRYQIECFAKFFIRLLRGVKLRKLNSCINIKCNLRDSSVRKLEPVTPGELTGRRQ